MILSRMLKSAVSGVGNFPPGRIARIKSHVAFRYPPVATLMTIGRLDDSSDPKASVCISQTLLDASNSEENFKYLTFYFEEDGENADVAWTVKYSTALGDRIFPMLLQQTMQDCRFGNADEVTTALNQFLMRLEVIQRLRNTQSHKDQHREKAPPPDEIFPTDQDKLRDIIGENMEQQLRSKMAKWAWSCEKVCQLITLRLAGRSISSITKRLNKTSVDVARMLKALGTAPFEHTIIEGPQAVPDELRISLFQARLHDIWHVLSRDKMTDEWQKVIANLSEEELLSTISRNILPEVKYILGGVQPPSFEQICALPATESEQAGVYARLVESKFKYQGPVDRMLYIGSAASPRGGLDGRIAGHKDDLKRQPRKCEMRVTRNIRARNLKRPGQFRILMVMSNDSPNPKDVDNVRRTIENAEALLTIWLGALQDTKSTKYLKQCTENLRQACPWLLETLDYFPWSSHNPLTADMIHAQPLRSSGDLAD